MKPLDKIIPEVVGIVIRDAENTEIFNELSNMADHAVNNNYTVEDRKVSFPLFSDYTVYHLRKIRLGIKKHLLEEVEKPERTYLEIFRIVVALDMLYTGKKFTFTSKKALFCEHYWRLCNESLGNNQSMIAMLDN